MSLNKTRGEHGEALAAEYLKKKGYTILERNFRFKRAEVDIIAKKEKLLLFVEVKARTNEHFGFPEEAVDQKKAALIIMAANQYIYDKQWHDEIRFDIIAISLKEKTAIYHLEDAFY